MGRDVLAPGAHHPWLCSHCRTPHMCLSDTLLQSREHLRLCRAGAGAYAAAMRRAAAHFHLAQLAAGAGALHAAVNALLPRLPGAAFAACEP